MWQRRTRREQNLLESSRVRRTLRSGGDQMGQNFQNHVKFVPVFHFFVLPVLLFNVGWAIYRVIHAPSAYMVVALIVAIALLLAGLCGLMFALAVQDRLIRLGMQLLLQGLLPAVLRPRRSEFSVIHLLTLRIA